MPLINNNSAHMRARWVRAERGTGHSRSTTGESFVPIDAGVPAGRRPVSTVTFSLYPRGLVRTRILGACGSAGTVHWKINAVGIFVGHVASDILARSRSAGRGAESRLHRRYISPPDPPLSPSPLPFTRMLRVTEFIFYLAAPSSITISILRRCPVRVGSHSIFEPVRGREREETISLQNVRSFEERSTQEKHFRRANLPRLPSNY